MGGEYATFRFVAPLQRSLLQQILGCGVTNSYTRSASVTRWTAGYSGTKVDGDLPLYNRTTRFSPSPTALATAMTGAIPGEAHTNVVPSGPFSTTTTRVAVAGTMSRVGRGTRLAPTTPAATRSPSAPQRLFKAPPPARGAPFTVRT